MHPIPKKCPTCGSGKIKVVHSDYVARVGGHEVVVPRLERQECPNCGEVLFDCAAMERLEALRPKNRRRASHAGK
jgi:YgiT-type zinc finger domain-containing protein